MLTNPLSMMKLTKSYTKKNTSFLSNFKNELTCYENCEKVDYCGSTYAIGNFIISSCEKFAFKIIQIALAKSNDELKLITEKYSLKYVKALRSFQLGESINLQECLDVNSFYTPSICKHTFEGREYLRKEDF